MRWMLVAYALLNALLYSLLLPLWEGFDEPFHFGYVQQLANRQGWPDPRTTPLSAEIAWSLALAPEANLVAQQFAKNRHPVATFQEYLALPAAIRAAIRRSIRETPPDSRWEPGAFRNYEGLQAPLAYIVMALPERLLSRVPLPDRVAALRVLFAAISSLALLTGARRLFHSLRLPEPFADAALFCMLSCQMLWATIAHVANDWLAAALSVWLLNAMIACIQRPDLSPFPKQTEPSVIAAAIFGAALLTKAYYLAFAPLLAIVCWWRGRWRNLAWTLCIVCLLAAPWYARNLSRYGDLSGTVETQSHSAPDVLRAAAAMPWLAAAEASMRAAIWTGNNSLTAFSSVTEYALLGALMTGWAVTLFRRPCRVDWVVLAYCASFTLFLAYDAVISWVSTNGAVKTPQPWYAQVLVAPVFGLALLGAASWRRGGRLLATATVFVSGYILAATYVVKLIPLYGGFAGRTTLRAIFELYSRGWGELASNLDTVAMASSRVLLLLTALTIGLGIGLQIVLVKQLWSAEPAGQPKSST